MEASIKWIKEYGFLAKSASGHALLMDAPVASGGNNLGPSPMEVVLLGAAGCMSYDIVNIVRKSRHDIRECSAQLIAEQAPEVPRVFTKIEFKFTLEGNLTREQVQKAIDLSAEKYCSVSIMLGKTADISFSFEIILPS